VALVTAGTPLHVCMGGLWQQSDRQPSEGHMCWSKQVTGGDGLGLARGLAQGCGGCRRKVRRVQEAGLVGLREPLQAEVEDPGVGIPSS